MVFLGSWLCQQLLLTQPAAQAGRALAEEGHSQGLLRVPGEEQQEHPGMLPTGLLLSRSQCQQVASPTCRGGASLSPEPGQDCIHRLTTQELCFVPSLSLAPGSMFPFPLAHGPPWEDA